MNTIEILYSTKDGQALKIALAAATQLRDAGFTTHLADVRQISMLDDPAGVLLVASVRFAKHDKAAVAAVRKHLRLLNDVPSAFISVSMSAAGTERNVADGYVKAFLQQTGWKPTLTAKVAGAIGYTEYNFILKLVMRSIARKQGLATDTSQDHEYTDWHDVSRFVGQFAGILSGKKQEASAAPTSCPIA